MSGTEGTAQAGGRPEPLPGRSQFSFVRLAAGVLLYNASGGVLYAVLPLFEFQRGGSALLATLIVGAPLLATTFGMILWGTLSDRWGRRRELLAFGVFAQAAIFLLYPFLGPMPLLIARVGQAFLGASFALATTEATEDPHRKPGAGLGGVSLWGSLGAALGIVAALPFLGGTRFTPDSPSSVVLFLLLGALSVASVVFLIGTGELPRPRSTTPVRAILRFQEGRTVLVLCAATAVISCGNYIVYTLFPLYVDWAITPQNPFGQGWNSIQQLAVLSIAAAMGGVIVSPWTGRVVEGDHRRRLYLVAPLVYALLWTAYAFVRYYPLVLLIWALPVYVILSIPLLREISGRTSGEERGRAVGLWNAAYSLGGLAGTLIAGGLFRGDSSFGPLFLLGAIVDLAAFGAFLGVPAMARSSPAHPGGTPRGAKLP